MNEAILILNILGTFFLSIEAIKIDNFQKIIIAIRNSNNLINPRIEWVDQKTKKSKGWKIEFDFLAYLLFFGTPTYFFIYYFYPNLSLWFKIPLTIFCGFILWTVIIFLNVMLIKILKAIVKYTTTGIIGLIGFLILSISFYLQFILASKAMTP